MALSDDAISRQNPWWTTADWERSDPHLRLLERQPARLPSPVVDRLDLDEAGLHTLRGPRQVGKSTDLKLLVRRALAAGRRPAEIVYLQLDALQDQPIGELDATVDRAKQVVRAGPGALVLLDEVTAIDGWDVAVKYLWDTGVLRDDVVVATGSSAYDLYRGVADRWPGRRGVGDDHLVLGQTFGAFARAVVDTIPASPRCRVADLAGPGGGDIIGAIRPHLGSLARAFDLYLRFGGLPMAASEAVSGETRPSPRVLRIGRDSVVRELQRRGASESAGRALIERIARSLGSSLSWAALAADMDVPLGSTRGRPRDRPTDKTVRSYVEFMGASYLAMTLYARRPDAAGNDLASSKKLYFGDPLTYWCALEDSGLRPDLPALAENAVALALFRGYEPGYQQITGFGNPTRVHAWRSRAGNEIDFIAGPRDGIDVVEVKYRERVDRRVLRSLGAAFPGRPAVVASKTELAAIDERTLILPVPLLVWALG